jgi:hypothetical protein
MKQGARATATSSALPAFRNGQTGGCKAHDLHRLVDRAAAAWEAAGLPMFRIAERRGLRVSR